MERWSSHIGFILAAVAFTSFISPDIFWSELGMATRRNRIIFFLCKYVIPAGLLLTIMVQLITGMTVPGTSFIPDTWNIGSLLQIEGVALFALLILIVYFIVRYFRK